MNPEHKVLTYEPDYDFDIIWNAHPATFKDVIIYDKKFKMPRWVEAYGKDYAYSGQTAKALPVPDWLQPFFDVAKQISPTVNGALVNWYDGKLKHKIGAHRDAESSLMKGSDIITVSLGEERVFRFRKYRTKDAPIDIVLKDRDMLVIPWNTNMTYTHEVPYVTKYQGKRISLTFRSFL